MGVLSKDGRKASGRSGRQYCLKAAGGQPVGVDGSIVQRRPEDTRFRHLLTVAAAQKLRSHNQRKRANEASEPVVPSEICTASAQRYRKLYLKISKDNRSISSKVCSQTYHSTKAYERSERAFAPLWNMHSICATLSHTFSENFKRIGQIVQKLLAGRSTAGRGQRAPVTKLCSTLPQTLFENFKRIGQIV